MGSVPAAAAGEKTRCYEMIFYQLRIGNPRLGEWAKQTMVPLFKKHGVSAFGCFQLALGVETPQMMVVIEHPGLTELESTWARIMADPAWQEAIEKRDAGQDPPFEKFDRRVVAATDYSPPLLEAVGKAKSPRYFEFRVYHSPTWKQLEALHERFSGPEIKIFHRSGIYPILYGQTTFGPDMPNLTYLMPFDSLAAREKAWEAFRGDPEWIKVRADSIAKAGNIVTYTTRLIFEAEPYSPIL
jgi:hypothetical protein